MLAVFDALYLVCLEEAVDFDVAQAYLWPYDLQDYVEIYRRWGGYALGLQLAAKAKQFAVPDAKTMVPEKVEAILRRDGAGFFAKSFPYGFAVKYSGYREAFSPFAARGVHSSHSHFWEGNGVRAAEAVIVQALADIPPETCTFVFQEYLRPPQISELVTFHAYENCVFAETVEDNARVLFEYADGVLLTSRVRTPYAIRRGDRSVHMDLLIRRVAALRQSLDFDIDLECFVFKGKPTITQLRPIPSINVDHDQYARYAETLQRRSRRGKWFNTPWAYGVWNGRGHVGIGNANGPAIFAKRGGDIRQETAIIERLQRGLPTLVIDLVDAFRLTHYPYLLPADIKLRNNFVYVSLADTHLATLSDGQFVTVVSDGQSAIVKAEQGN